MIKKIYGTISKTEELDDGTIKVFGYASSGSEDSDGEFISPEAMKEALPDYMKFGAVREMHGDSAAGTALEAKVLEDGKTWFGAHVVDPIAVLKVKTGTYKGFSIGGKVIERDNLNKNFIKKIKLVEVSLVDRPANPEAVFTMFKAEDLKESEKLDKDKKNIYNERKNKVMNKNEKIEKGLGNVQWIAQLVSELDFLYQNLQAEKEIEGDNSEIPDDLKNVITSLSSILVQSAQEETSELESQENQEPEVEVVDVDEDDEQDDNSMVEMSNKIKNLKKSGARNSQKDQATLNQILSLLKELGADESKEDESDNKDNKEEDNEKDDNKKSSKIDNLEKMNKEQSEFISELDKNLKKMIKEKNDLEKRISELEKEPNLEKRAILTSLEKSDDYKNSSKDEDYIVKNSKGEIDEVATAIKKAQKNGKRII
jgi:hypothetical protein